MSDSARTIDELVEDFLAERRKSSRVDAHTFAARHPELGSELVDALESLEAMEAMRRVEPAEAPLPANIGPFRMVREIGRGAMGVVLEAVEEPLGRRVALKLLPPELLASPSARARFQREAALASRLDHSGICTVYGAGVLDGQPWIAMRCLEGETLGKRIAAARAHRGRTLRLPMSDAVDPARSVAACIARVARSLAAAHAQGVLHRDVKPSNVMVTPSGEPVLLDFGLAIEHESEAASLTRTGEIAGTPAYLAPELIAGEVARSDAQCDVYSLGVTLYECLALEAPFRGPTRDALYRALLAGDAPDIRRANSSVPRDLAVIVATATERERAGRYASAEHLALDLEAFVARRPIAARPIGPWGRLSRWARREPRQALLAGSFAAAAVVALLSVGSLLASREKVRAGELAQRARAIDEAIFNGYLDLGEKRREAANLEFARVLELDPDNDEARVGRVFASIRLGRRDEALALLDEAPHSPAYDGLRALVADELPPAEDPAWLAGASAHELFIDGERLRMVGESRPPSEQVDWMRRALERFDEAVIRAPRARALYHQLRSTTAAAAGDARAARSAASALASLWPDSAAALYQAGSSLTDLEPAAAIPYLSRSAQLDSGRAGTFQCLGIAHLRLGEFDTSRAAFDRALEIDPNDVFAYNGLACVLDSLECPQEQRRALERALAIDPRQVQARCNLAALEWKEGDYAAAARALEQVLEVDPGLADRHVFLATMLVELGQPRRACDEMAIAVAYTPRDPAAWIEYAKFLLVAGEPRDALESARIARALDPSRPELDQLEEQAQHELDLDG